MSAIERSAGIPVRQDLAFYGMAGGGYSGATAELDALVSRAAEMLRDAYGMDVTIRFNSDRESGSAWLKTHETDGFGANSEIGIGGSVVTERTRQRWQREIERWSARFDREWTTMLRQRLATEPAGTIRIHAHIGNRSLVDKSIGNTSEDPERTYYHGVHESLKDALAFVLANGSIEHLSQ